MKKLQIGVIGWAGPEEYPKKVIPKQVFMLAQEVGQLVAQNDCILVTGGKGGIMSAAAKGAKEFGGMTLGVIQGAQRFQSNPDTDIEILTGATSAGLDEYLLVMISDALIVLGGGAGTLEEITMAYRTNKPVVILKNCGGWGDKLINKYLDERKRQLFKAANTPEQAVKKAIKLASPHQSLVF